MTAEGGSRSEGGKIPGIVDVDVEAISSTDHSLDILSRTRGMSRPWGISREAASKFRSEFDDRSNARGK